jgi:hypothetical protein
MVDSVDKATFEKGQAVIRREIDTLLGNHKITGADVRVEPRGPAGPLRVTLKVGSKAAEVEFGAGEVADSAHAIDQPAANKVRQLVSHFVA